MPREKQKRGRRVTAEDKRDGKRKSEEPPSAEPTFKRQKTTNTHDDSSLKPAENRADHGVNYIPLEEPSAPLTATDTPFYGLLDPEEQEYFSQANLTLELNQFESEEDRHLFVNGVFEEASGKELKVACSQSCSRLMEKLISMATTAQIKSLFEKFCGNFLHLSQHRFASHCCECLFLRAAPVVTHEMSKSKKEDAKGTPMADLFLTAITELEDNWGYLLTESFASHTIRVLLLVLAGEPLDAPGNTLLLASRKKENTDSVRSSIQSDSLLAKKRDVPASFTSALEKMMKGLVTGLDGTYLRALATHPTGSPVLQLLLSIELTHLGKSRANEPDSLLRRLVPDESLEDKDSFAFLNGLLFDPVGSRLLETIVRCTPGKFFKPFYKHIIRDRIGSLSRNELAAYVVVRVLERLSKEDLEAAMDSIVPEIQALRDRSRLTVIKCLIERSRVRGVDNARIADALQEAYGEDASVRLNNLLRLDENDQVGDGAEQGQQKPKGKSGPPPQQVHGSLLAQAMLQACGPLSELIRSSLLAVPEETLIKIAKNSTASHVLQESLVFSKSTVQFRRQATVRFCGHMCELALDTSASHVADALWHATTDLLYIKQRLAEELFQNESTLRDSFFGRAVWRNWSMDLYKRKRGDWMAKAKALGNIQSKGDSATVLDQPKSKLEIARERFAMNAANAEQSEQQLHKRKLSQTAIHPGAPKAKAQRAV
jgi:nucleolar protein 9